MAEEGVKNIIGSGVPGGITKPDLARQASVKDLVKDPIDEKIMPFIVRGLVVPEIGAIVEPVFDKQQVWSAFFRLIRQERLEVSTEGINFREKIAVGDKFEHETNEKKKIEFVRALWKKGLIPQDLSARQELFELYKSHGKSLPGEKMDILLLEIYLAAVKKAEFRENKTETKKKIKSKELVNVKNRAGDLVLYNDLGNQRGLVWFNSLLVEDRNFIKKEIANKLRGGASTVYTEEDDYYHPSTIKKREEIRKMVEEKANKEEYRNWDPDGKPESPVPDQS